MSPAHLLYRNWNDQITLNEKTRKTHCAKEHLDPEIPFSKSVRAENLSVISCNSFCGSVCILTVAKIWIMVTLKTTS